MTEKLIIAMTEYFKGDTRRIAHFLKVYAYARTIGLSENLDPKTQLILETAAIIHDIGIKNSELKYSSSDGKLQEKEGVPEAEKMLISLGFDADITERVCWLVGHHHTYDNINTPDYRILVESDFLVNLHEDKASENAIKSARNNIFKTPSAINILNNLFAL